MPGAALKAVHARSASTNARPRQGCTGLSERYASRQVEDDNAGAQPERRERTEVVGNAHGFDRHVRVASDPRVDRCEKVLPFELEAIAAEIEVGDRVGPGG